eukprot:CAMPEP_0198210508 /NCGR_PEP_ID=MMETSP1445-20131203/20214_1 /TAXON_ID=36898 /ORGANISM="Pyramimonas sp., Strain CCMP2087" /LENGTH=96 /DNA_ID=CAMNT_0043884585 /DNA_START=80 /DNA_END=370 /DNA_ORIENTATION=+
MAARTFASTWIRPEIYPLALTLGAAVGLAGFFTTRCMIAHPDVRVAKSDRAMGVLEEDRFYKEGEGFFNHSIRRWAKSQDKTIMPGLNAKLGGGNY